MWGITSVLWGNSFSTVEAPQCTGEIASVQQNDSLSTTEIVQYSAGIKSVCGRTTSVHAGG